MSRNYPPKLIDEQMSRAGSEGGQRTQREGNKGPVLVTTYHPALNDINKILNKHSNLLQVNDDLKALFQRPPMVAFKNPKALRNVLVRAKLPAVTRTKGSFKCNGPRCKICEKVVETDCFTSFVTGETFHINFELNCNSCCIIYLFECIVCWKQLVGECTTAWRDRWHVYTSDSRKAQRGEHHMQKEVHAHFKLPGHTSIEKDVRILFIDKTDPMFPKKREKFWMEKLQTMSPNGFNVSGTM